MKIAQQKINRTCPEVEIYNSLLSLDNCHILELGCGKAEITRNIVTSGQNRRITALEVDEIAHQKNMQVTDLPDVTFILAGAEEIPLENESVDVAMMFKSLHHVPVNLMQQAMHEIYRVLKPGGLLYISEPVFAGEFNEILRLFHDEQAVRQAAFNTITKVVEEGLYELVDEIFFNSPMHFSGFAEFENNTIKATHSNHQLDNDLYKLVKTRFEQYVGEDGARFLMPIRVDLLRRPVVVR
jgi:ubiquinone/menaquinone biosynthesis C-methylase UbiE